MVSRNVSSHVSPFPRVGGSFTSSRVALALLKSKAARARFNPSSFLHSIASHLGMFLPIGRLFRPVSTSEDSTLSLPEPVTWSCLAVSSDATSSSLSYRTIFRESPRVLGGSTLRPEEGHWNEHLNDYANLIFDVFESMHDLEIPGIGTETLEPCPARTGPLSHPTSWQPMRVGMASLGDGVGSSWREPPQTLIDMLPHIYEQVWARPDKGRRRARWGCMSPTTTKKRAQGCGRRQGGTAKAATPTRARDTAKEEASCQRERNQPPIYMCATLGGDCALDRVRHTNLT